MLESRLDRHRATLALECAGRDDAQVRVAAAEPSRPTPLGPVRRTAEGERNRFQRIAGGQDVPAVCEECARRNGHADLLRERIGGATGG
ncbi:DUF664 domain-containing protein [Streptomyces sp. NPDC096105]|uniref:mycothiol transferase n=1 Tax=Streptomyces sp. NPDC096105 TaxID=3366074 RepID=UPI00381759DE